MGIGRPPGEALASIIDLKFTKVAHGAVWRRYLQGYTIYRVHRRTSNRYTFYIEDKIHDED